MRECPNPVCNGALAVKGAQIATVECSSCGMRGPMGTMPTQAIALWDSLPRATVLGRREIIDKQLHDEYNGGDISYKSLAELHGLKLSRVFSGIQRHRKLLKEGF